MKTWIIAFITAFSSFAAPLSINPDKVVYPLVEVFENYWLWGEDKVKVYGLEFNKKAFDERDRYIEKGVTHILPKDVYKKFQDLAQGVFEAEPGGHADRFGTAFHVGGDLVLTNLHVLSFSDRDGSSCGGFEITLNYNQGRKRLECKQVLHCNKGMDYCLIEMERRWAGERLSLQKAPILRLNPTHSGEVKTIAIGNSRGFGIHASMGKGFIRHNQGEKFHAPIFAGNSGGPVFNEKGEVIAVTRAQSQELYSNNAYNIGIPVKLIQRDLIHALGENNQYLRQIKFK